MIDVETIEIDGVEYLIAKTIKEDNNEYFLLANISNPKDFMLAKKEIIDNEEYIAEIIDQEEYKKVIELFAITK